MANNAKLNTVTALVHQSGVITAFFNQMPGLVVQGSNEDDIKRKLGILLDSYIKRLQAIDHDFDLTPQSF